MAKVSSNPMPGHQERKTAQTLCDKASCREECQKYKEEQTCIGPRPAPVSCPSVPKHLHCAPVCPSVPQCAFTLPQCSTVCLSVPQCAPMCPSVPHPGKSLIILNHIISSDKGSWIAMLGRKAIEHSLEQWRHQSPQCIPSHPMVHS